MTKLLTISIFSILVVTSLSACGYKEGPNLEDAQYWQRENSAEYVYTRGPKAQQMLNRDIGHCVAEMRELVRLGALRQGTVTANSTNIQDPDMREMRKWDDPKRDGYMLAEHSNFHDFEGCMKTAGWDRVKYVPYDVATQGRRDYVRSHVDYRYQTRKRDADRQDHNNMDLNE